MVMTLLRFSTNDPRNLPTGPNATVTSPNTLTLGKEIFTVDNCTIWGYLGNRDGKWYCRWCIDADAAKRTFTEADEDEQYTFEMQPTLSGNSLPINVPRWRELDGVEVRTGADEDVEYFDNQNHSAIYTLRSMTSYEKCFNNLIKFHYLGGNKFRVFWTGNSFVHGIGGDSFSLDAIATLTKISLSSQIDDESKVDDVAIRQIFETVFPNEDLVQHHAVIRKYVEDGVLNIRFDADFLPKI